MYFRFYVEIRVCGHIVLCEYTEHSGNRALKRAVVYPNLARWILGAQKTGVIKLVGKNKIIVKIAGNEYTLCGGESVEYMQRVALYVDRKTMEIMKANHTLSTSMASVLTAVNVTDEMFKRTELSETLQKELEQNKKALEELSQEKLLLTQQVQKANEENKHLLLELTRREAELSEVRNALARATGDNPPKPRLHNIK